MVLVKSAVLALGRIWALQHHGNIPRIRTGAASAILPNTATRRSSKTHHCRKQDNRLRILRSGPSTRRSGGNDSHDKQIADAFRMQHRDGEVHADIIFTTPCGAWPVVLTATGGLRKIQPSCHTHMDEDAVGKGFHVRDNSDHPVGIRRLPKGRG